MREEWLKEYIKFLYAGDANKAMLLKNVNIPSSLFRYERFADYRILTLSKFQLYLSSPKNFNDVYDTKGIYYSQAFLDSIYGRFQATPQDFQDIFDKLLDDYYLHCGIACFSEDRDNYPMWWSYADCHSGYCIEYDFASLKETNPKFLYNMHPVLYLAEKFNFDKLLIALTDNLAEDEPLITPEMLLFHNLLGTIKHRSWSYEKEWRYIRTLRQENTAFPVKVKAIYLGNRFAKDNIKIMESVSAILNCDLYQMATSGHMQKPYTFIPDALLTKTN